MRVNHTTGLLLAGVIGMSIPSSLFAQEGPPFAHWIFDQADGKTLPNAIDSTFHATARS